MTARQFLIGGAVAWVLFGVVAMVLPITTWLQVLIGACVYIAVFVSLGCLLFLGPK